MSSTRTLVVPEATVKQLAYIAKNFPKLGLKESDNFWMVNEEEGGYDWSQVDIGVNAKGNLIVGTQSGCSCNGPEEPTADEEYPLNGDISVTAEGYYCDIRDLLPDLQKLSETLYDLLRGKKVPADAIIAIPNAEVRRAAINFVGFDKFVKDANPDLLDDDPAHGRLLRVKLNGDEDLVLLLVKDASTPRKYFLRVPPEMKTAAQARAWTFGMTPESFSPAIET